MTNSSKNSRTTLQLPPVAWTKHGKHASSRKIQGLVVEYRCFRSSGHSACSRRPEVGTVVSRIKEIEVVNTDASKTYSSLSSTAPLHWGFSRLRKIQEEFAEKSLAWPGISCWYNRTIVNGQLSVEKAVTCSRTRLNFRHGVAAVGSS